MRRAYTWLTSLTAATVGRKRRERHPKEVRMAKPITGISPFSGKEAERFRDYLKNAKPDPRKAERAKEDAAIYAKIKRVDNAKVRCK